MLVSARLTHVLVFSCWPVAELIIWQLARAPGCMSVIIAYVGPSDCWAPKDSVEGQDQHKRVFQISSLVSSAIAPRTKEIHIGKP